MNSLVRCRHRAVVTVYCALPGGILLPLWTARRFGILMSQPPMFQ